MLIANEPKFEDMRVLVDEEVTRRVLEHAITRTEAYVSIAREFGYHIRAFSGNEGWACVIALPGYEWLSELADRLMIRKEQEIQPLINKRDQMSSEIATALSELKKDLFSNKFNSIDAANRLTKIQNVESDRDEISRTIDRQMRRMNSDFAFEFCKELANQIVVFGVTVEVAIIACILRILDPQCDAFLGLDQIRASYTKQDLCRKAGTLHSRFLKQHDEAIPLLDDTVDASQRILALGVSRMIRGFIRQNFTTTSAE